MLGVPQPCEYSPEENHSNSTELEMHMGVKEQAALSGIAERGRCEAFLCKVSIHPSLSEESSKDNWIVWLLQKSTS